MAAVLKPKRSSTPSAVPTTSTLADGEMAVNIADKAIYVRDGSTVVKVADVGGGGGASQPPAFTAKDANYTFVAGDAGLGYAVTTTTSRTYTIPNGVFSAGDMIWVASQNTGQITLARASGVTLRLGGSTNNSNRLVGPYGMACIYFLSGTSAVVYGSGVG